MASGQPDYTRQVAVTVIDTPDPITVIADITSPPLNVTFPSTQDVNVKSQTANVAVDVKSMPASSSVAVSNFPSTQNVDITAQAAALDVNIKHQDITPNVAVTSVPSNMTTVPSLPFITGVSKSYENAAFVTGSSPATHLVNSGLGRNGNDGWLVNDGPGDLKFAFSVDGTNYGDDATVKSGETMKLTHLDMNKIRITWVADCGYRIFVV